MYATFPENQKNTWAIFAFKVSQYLKHCNKIEMKLIEK